MTTSIRTTGLSLAVALLLANGAVQAGPREDTQVLKAMDVLDQSTKIPENGIPAYLLDKAQGVLIMPNVVKAGFLIGGRHGHGVLLVRCKDGSWSNPVFVTLSGGSVGWQGGIQSADLILVFKTAAGVERILQGKGKLTLGGDVSIAAGPVGRQSSAATDAMLKAEIFSYSRSRGLFLGLSLEGDGLFVNWNGNTNYYGRAFTPAEIVGGRMPIPESAVRLRTMLTNLSGPKAAPPVIVVPGKPLTSEPPLAPIPPR